MLALDTLGTSKRVSITKDETTIVDGGVRKDIENVAQIRSQIEATSSDYDRENFKNVHKLAGGVAVIKVGGSMK